MHGKYSYLDSEQIMPTMNLERTLNLKNKRLLFCLIIINTCKRVCTQCNKEGALRSPYCLLK